MSDVNISSEQAKQRARLRWACRRGMLELDCFLLPVVDNLYDKLSVDEQACFQRLLTENDQDLYAWLVGQSVPEDEGYQRLCGKIKNKMVPLLKTEGLTLSGIDCG